MDADYPAAHSADTTWFAVDADGHVGVFDSGQNGAVPEGAEPVDQYWLVRTLQGPSAAGNWPPAEVWREAVRLGLFWFQHDDDFDELPFPSPYGQGQSPATPLHVNQLPPQYRELARRIRLENVRFSDGKGVQPVEHVACQVWDGEAAFAYLASDGVTIRPLPGREDLFAAHREELREYFPDFRIEG
jgi:hypothetical protein